MTIKFFYGVIQFRRISFKYQVNTGLGLGVLVMQKAKLQLFEFPQLNSFFTLPPQVFAFPSHQIGHFVLQLSDAFELIPIQLRMLQQLLI